MKSLTQYIFEGGFEWFKEIFKRTKKFQDAYIKRNGKLPELKIDDVSKLQVSKPLKGTFDNETVKSITESGFNLFQKFYNKRKDYFVDNDDNEMKLESTMYVYVPENALGSDEKYICGLAIKGDKELIEHFTHIVDFEVSNVITNGKNISNDLFKVYVDSIKKNSKGVTMKFFNNANDFPFKYNGKTFQSADETKHLIKLEF